MSELNEDPILDIRCAIAAVLQDREIDCDHKAVTDAIVDRLPSFFRQALKGAKSEQSLTPSSLREAVKSLFLLMYRAGFRQAVITRVEFGECKVGLFEPIRFDAHSETVP